METTTELANRIINEAKKQCFTDSPHGLSQWVQNQICFYLDDVSKLISNIEDTSLNSKDRASRYIEMEAKFEIPKTHLILKRQ